MPKRITLIALLAALVLYALRLIALLNISAPRYGFDYGFFIPRLMEGVASFRSQGLVPPYYSPFLCGGFPLYADPQSMFYSLPQFIGFLVDPWSAIQITIFILVLAAGLGTFFLARKVFALPDWAAFSAALLFCGNGFFRSRMLIGHLSFHSFMLLPLLSLALLFPGAAVLWPALLFASVLALMVHAGAHYTALFSLISLSLLLGLLVACRHLKRAGFKTLLARAGLGGTIALGLSLSKLYAATILMRNHPRPARFDYLNAPADAVQLLYVQFIDPLASLPLKWGRWEYDASLSVVTWPGVIAALLMALWSLRNGANKVNVIAGWSVFIGVFYLLGVATGTAPGLVFLKELPLLRQMRVNMRFSSTLLLPLCLFSALGYAAAICRIPSGRRALAAGWLVCAAAACSVLFGVQRYSAEAQSYMSFDGSRIAEFYASLKSGSAASPARIGKPAHDDFASMVNLEANPRCYTALWSRPPTRALREGPVGQLRGSEFNLINPSCYWYPEENGCRPGTLIQAGQAKELQTLLEHKNPAFYLSAGQQAANVVNLLFLVVWAILFGCLLRRATHKARP